MQIFAELTAALPAKKEEVEQLDKASVMRLAISYLRVRDVVSMCEYFFMFFYTMVTVVGSIPTQRK